MRINKLTNEINKLTPELLQIYNDIIKIKNNKPNLKKILSSNLGNREKYACLEIYKKILSSTLKEEREELTELIDEILINNQPKKINPIIEKYINKLNSYSNDDMPGYIRDILQSKIDMMKEVDSDSSAFESIREYLSIALELPYNRKREFLKKGESRNDFLLKVKNYLDENLYGMEKVKQQLLLALNNKLSNPSSQFSIALSGAPGVGKTRIATVFAEAIGFPIEKISLGGLNDSSVFKGSDKHWSGSSPSILLQSMSRMKISNGIILFDEIDKINGDRGYDVVNSLIHITDYTQNHEFSDSFISDFPHDISNVMFFFSMNDENHVNHVLLDRLNVFNVESYTLDQIAHIAYYHSFPKEFKKVGLDTTLLPNVESVSKLVKLVYGNINSKTGVRKIDKIVKFITTCFNFEVCTNFNFETFIPNANKKLLSFEAMVNYYKSIETKNDFSSISHIYL